MVTGTSFLTFLVRIPRLKEEHEWRTRHASCEDSIELRASELPMLSCGVRTIRDGLYIPPLRQFLCAPPPSLRSVRSERMLRLIRHRRCPSCGCVSSPRYGDQAVSPAANDTTKNRQTLVRNFQAANGARRSACAFMRSRGKRPVPVW